MPEVNTTHITPISEKEWNYRHNLIQGYRKGILTRKQFCFLWGTAQILENYGDATK